MPLGFRGVRCLLYFNLLAISVEWLRAFALVSFCELVVGGENRRLSDDARVSRPVCTKDMMPPG